MMDGDSGQLNLDQAEHTLRAVLGDCADSTVYLLLPTWMRTFANTLCRAFAAVGCTPSLELVAEPDPETMSVTACADRWVPEEHGAAQLLVLCGVRPWRHPVDGDHLIEIAAMQRREALLAAGQRMLFVDWPRGARRDAEIDLRPLEMARLYRRAYTVDYGEMRRWNASLLAIVQDAQQVHITCPAGTNLTLSTADRSWCAEDCELGSREPAVYLPGGEVYTAAIENSANGLVAFHHIGEPRLAHFEAGLLTAVERPDGTADTELGEEMGVGHEPLCELGIGTNAWAPPWQVGTLYEKSAGTVHVAVGGNAHFGGQRDSPRHMDLIIRAPLIAFDGRPLELPDGRWNRDEERS